MFSRRVWGSLRAKIIAWSFVPTAIILLMVAIVSFIASQRIMEELIIERDKAVIFVAVEKLASQLSNYTDFLEGVARTPAIYQKSLEGQRNALHRAESRLAIFDAGVVLLDAEGIVLATEPERSELHGQNWNSRPYYQTLANVRGGLSTTPIFSDVLTDGEEEAEVIAVAVPVIGPQGEFRGVLAGMFHIGPEFVSPFYGDLIRLRFGQNGNAFLVDGKGKVIFHTRPNLIGSDFSNQVMVRQLLEGPVRSGAERTHDVNGEDIVAGFSPVPGTSWGLVTEDSWSNLSSSNRRYQNSLILLLGMGILLPVVVVSVGVKHITQPITDLTVAAQEVARGNFGRTITANTHDEIEELAHQFNTMSAQLHESYANLEQKVAGRTRELATLNAISAVVSLSLNLDEVLSNALDKAIDLLGMDIGAIWLIDQDFHLTKTEQGRKPPDGPPLMRLMAARGISEEFGTVLSNMHSGEGISGVAIRLGKPVVLRMDEYPSRNLSPYLLKEGIQTLVSAPILHQGQPLGALSLAVRVFHEFPPQELDLLGAIGQQVGVAVANARLYQRAQQEINERRRAEAELLRVSDERARRNRELLLLNRVITATTSKLEPTAVLEAVCSEMSDAFDVPQSAVALLDPSGDYLTVVAEYRGEGRPSALGAVIPVADNLATRYVLENQAPLVVSNVQEDPRMAPIRELMRQRGVASMLLLPLLVGGKIIGTIGLDAVEERLFTESEIVLAMNVTAAAAQALDNARAEEALRESEARYRSISELTSDYVYRVTVTSDGAFLLDWFTDAFSRLTGFTPEDLRGRGGWLKLIHPDDLAGYLERRRIMLESGRPDILEYRIASKAGNILWLRDYWKPEWDEHQGRVTRMLGASQDITERKQAEEDLRQAKEAAETANRAKSTFLANMSHELRTPLNAILGFAQLMVRDPLLNSEQRENLMTIHRSGEHLLTLINDVLEMSKIEAGRSALVEQSFDLYNMLESLEEMFYLRAAEKGLELLFEMGGAVPQFVTADEGKLRQVLINLLSNAVKFTASGGVTLRVRRAGEVMAAVQENAENPANRGECLRLEFEVEDTGQGIAPDELEKIFDPFVQSDTGRKSQEGTGLGLSISRQFVRLMGGEISVSSSVGQGSRFRFDTVVGVADAGEILERKALAPRQVTGLAPGQPTFRLLIAEDRESSRRLLVKLLQPLGFDLMEAVNGLEAVQRWETWKPDLIWMDMRMPVMDGYEATRRIKAASAGAGEGKGEGTKIIALTASAFEEDRAQILKAGCDGFVRKPFREQEIFDALEAHLGVQFLYAEPGASVAGAASGKPENGDLSLEALQAELERLPAGWADELLEAARRADTEMFAALLTPLQENNPQLGTALQELVDNFRFDVILEMAEQLNGTSPVQGVGI